MEERRKLLAKSLMDLSKIILAGIFIQFFIDPSKSNIVALFVILAVIISSAVVAWFVMPVTSQLKDD